MTDLTWHDTLTPARLADLRALLVAVRDADGRPSLDDGDSVPREFRGGANLFATEDGTLVGLAHLATEGDAFGRQVAELLVRPDRRHRGIGTALAGALFERAEPDVRVWSHGDHPDAAAIAKRFGRQRVRELRRMLLDPLERTALPEPSFRDGVRLRAFLTGRDEAAVIEVNRRAFDWHPEQGALTVDDLVATEAEPWFDPAGFLLAVDGQDRLLGFHWTKVHPGPGRPMGEVYVIGIDPDAQGGGLGTALTLAGLHHLAGRGVDRVMLYVEADNPAAIALYTRLGFTVWDVDVQYAR